MIKFVPRAIIQYLIYACALLYKRELKKAVHQPTSLTAFFKDRGKGFVSKGSKDVLHGNKIFSYTIELPNESASFVVLFVVVCSNLGRICDFCFSQKCWKSYCSCDKKKLFSYDIIRSI